MTTRAWLGPTDVGSAESWLEMSDADWSDISGYIANKIGRDPPQVLRNGLNNAVFTWSVANDLNWKNTPPQIRLRLQKALKEAISLKNSINNIDGNGRQIINENPNYSVTQLYEDLERILNGIIFGLLEANKYPKNGIGVKNHAQRELASELIFAIRNHLGEEYVRRGRSHLFYYLYQQLAARIIHPRQDELKMGRIGVDEKEVGRLLRQALERYSSRPLVQQRSPEQG